MPESAITEKTERSTVCPTTEVIYGSDAEISIRFYSPDDKTADGDNKLTHISTTSNNADALLFMRDALLSCICVLSSGAIKFVIT